MDLHLEQEIAHNGALGATALWYFARGYFDSRQQIAGPTLPEVLLVLPIVFHQRSAQKIYRMKQASGLPKALLDEPELPVGLQRRLEGYADISFSALNLASASGLLDVDPDEPWPRYTPGSKTLPGELRSLDDEVRQILDAAKRLGWWLAHEDLNSLCSLLRVRF